MFLEYQSLGFAPVIKEYCSSFNFSHVDHTPFSHLPIPSPRRPHLTAFPHKTWISDVIPDESVSSLQVPPGFLWPRGLDCSNSPLNSSSAD